MSSKKTVVGHINLRILVGIIAAAVIFQIILTSIEESELVEDIVFLTAIINPLAVAIASWIVSRRYKDSKVFGRAYISLGVAYFAVFLAEITYMIYEKFLGIDPYPSIADVFFFALYPFALIHLILNIRFFNPSFSSLAKFWLIVFPLSMIVIYTIFSIGFFREPNFDFYYGIIFVSGSAVTMSFAIFGARIFQKGTLGAVWLVLVLGILSNTIGDIWYYYLEVLEEYSLNHVVNLFWYVSYWIILYSLYKHKEAI